MRKSRNMNRYRNNMNIATFIAATCLLLTCFKGYSKDRISFYSSNLKTDNDIKFRAAAFPWSTSLRKLEAEGRVKLHYSGIKKLPGKPKSYMIDVSLDKCVSKWGARAMWTTKKPIIPIKLNKPVFFTGYAFAKQLPSNTMLKFGVIFDGIVRKTGKSIKGGCLDFKHTGVSPNSWLVFQKNISDFIKKKGFDNAVMTGWQFTIYSPKDFYGQRVKAYLGDVKITNYAPEVKLTAKKKKNKNNIHISSKINMLPGNTSFEGGDENWNLKLDRKTKTVYGAASLELPSGKAVWSKAYYDILSVNKPYTCSFYAKASKNCRLVAGVYGTSHEELDRKSFKINPKWHRYTLTIPTNAVAKLRRHWSSKNDKIVKYGIKFLFAAKTPGAKVWLDAVQINQGSAAKPFEPGNDIVASILIPPCPKGVISVKNKSLNLGLNIYNSRKKTVGIDTKFYIKDYYGHNKFTKLYDFEVGTDKLVSKSVKIDSLQTGFYEAVAEIYVMGQKVYTARRSFVIAPETVLSSEPFMGLHPSIILQHDLKALDVIGVHFVRVFFHAWIAKCVNGKWQFPAYWSLKPYAEKHMKPLVSTAWRWKKPSEVPLQNQLNDYVEYCRQLVRKYGAYTKYWEIENEPNGTMPRGMGLTQKQAAKFYARVLLEASKAIKQIQPEAVICVGLNGWDDRHDYLWYRSMLDKAKGAFDVIAVHPYADQRMICSEKTDMGPEAVNMKQRIEKVRALIKEYNGKQQVWVGEIGWSLDCSAPIISEPSRRHARYMARAVLQAKAAGAKKVLYFIEEGVYEKKGFEYGFWLSDKQPRPIVAAYATIAQMIEDSKFIKPIVETKRIYAYLFEKHGKAFASVWQVDGSLPTKMLLNLSSSEIRILDLMNNPLPVKKNSKGEIIIPISADPIFIFSEKLSTKQFGYKLDEAKWDIPPVKLNLYAASSKKIVCEINNNYKIAQYGKISIKSPKLSFVKSSRQFKLSPGGSTVCKFELQTRSLTGENNAELKLKTNKGQITKSYKLNLTPCKYKKVNIKSSFKDSVKGLKPIVLNNRSSILPADPFVQWKGKNDLSVKAYTAWDEENFYFMADVTDDIHCQKHNKGKLWASDSIQMAFDTKANAEESAYSYDGDDFEMTMALSGKKSLWNFNYGGEGTKSKQAPTVTISRKNKHTYYKCAIPWKRLNITATAGKAYGFNFIINEDEGSGRFHFMGMTPGIGEKKYPYIFKKFYLAR